MSEIIVLKGPALVRMRPHLFFSRQDAEGVHAMILDLLCYSIQEHQLGLADNINITKHGDGSYSLMDNGAGLPIEPEGDIDGWQQLFCGFFPVCKEGEYVFGIGNDRTRALEAKHGRDYLRTSAFSHFAACSASIFFEVETYHGYHYKLRFEKGILIGDVSKSTSSYAGTCLHFLPDKEIFGGNIDFDFSKISHFAEEQMLANPGLTIIATEEDPS